ncbi:MAG TPA: response regulator transcription factor [Fimbriimonadaceae bacterium]|nr:response regulator transcription factor [Fimbriimonadaceae bacterium]
MPDLLVVDDDRFLQQSLERLLTEAGYRVPTEGSTEEGLRAIVESEPDLMILDLSLPGVDGISFCRQIRAKWRFPVLMLTARTDAMDKVIGLEVGADDYLTKPFEPAELLARVRAQLRRTTEYDAKKSRASEDIVRAGSLEIRTKQREVRVGENVLELTAKEFDLLFYFAKNAGTALSREMLFEKVWGFEIEFNSNSLDVFVYRLRQKLEQAGGIGHYLQTVRGYGYKLQP